MCVGGSSWHLVQAIIIVQGLASALPWNVYVTESEYFTLRVHVPPFNRVLADNFENVNLLTSQAACAALHPFRVLVTFQQHCQAS